MAVKGRPKKIRYLQRLPKILQFSPRGKPGRPDEIELLFEQYEALKLADFQGFNQEQGAWSMRLSRASFGRILREARKKVADALVNGKSIKIRMGNVQVGIQRKDFTISGEFSRFQERSSKIVGEIGEIVSKNKKSQSKREVKNKV